MKDTRISKVNKGVVKIGGARGNDLLPLLKDLAERTGKGEKWLLVHGASGYMEDLSEKCGFEPKYVTSPGGYRSRFTGKKEKDIFRYACNALSTEINCQFTAMGVPSGFLYPDIVKTASARRKDVLKIVENGRTRLLRGNYSGTVTAFDPAYVDDLFEKNILPVIPPLASDVKTGEPVNVDGDRLAAAAASALKADVLVILSNVPGLLEDIEKPESLVTLGKLADWEKLENIAKGNMKRKLLAAREALEANVPVVKICDSRLDHPLTNGLEGGGTTLCP